MSPAPAGWVPGALLGSAAAGGCCGGGAAAPLPAPPEGGEGCAPLALASPPPSPSPRVGSDTHLRARLRASAASTPGSRLPAASSHLTSQEAPPRSGPLCRPPGELQRPARARGRGAGGAGEEERERGRAERAGPKEEGEEEEEKRAVEPTEEKPEGQRPCVLSGKAAQVQPTEESLLRRGGCLLSRTHAALQQLQLPWGRGGMRHEAGANNCSLKEGRLPGGGSLGAGARRAASRINREGCPLSRE